MTAKEFEDAVGKQLVTIDGKMVWMPQN